MLFNSYIFIGVFLPVTLLGFFAAGRVSPKAAGGFLLAASLVFYGWWSPAYLLLLVGSIIGNYALGRAIGASAGRERLQNWVLGGGIAANLGLLIRYKYLTTLLGALHAAFAPVPVLPAIVLPLGISFFTFTQIGYLIDRRAGLAVEEGPLSYALFVTFFPHLIAGPIVSNREIIPRFAAPATYRPNGAHLVTGGAVFVIGLLKKCLLADPLSPIVHAGFAAPASLSAFAAWHATLAYSLQLYFDFSGYSDMAIGLAQMFNVRFPLNFNAPYRAQSVIEYWQRWHITLTRWLTLYLFNPLALGAVRRRAARGLPPERPGRSSLGGFIATLLVPLFITMTLAGIWHGSGLQFLLFGLLHSMLLSLNHAWRCFGPGRRAGRKPSQSPAAIAGRVVLTYFSVLIGAVLFRAASAGSAFAMLAAMAGAHGLGIVALPGAVVAALGAPGAGLTRLGVLVPAPAIAAGQVAAGWLWLAALYGLIFLAPTTQAIIAGTARPRFRLTLPWAIAGGAAAMVGLLSVGGTTEFLYFQF